MNTRKFQRKIENFTCLNCGQAVIGNGYTNHCPHCLWSLHVDINPGDRAASCRGSLEPYSAETEGQEIVIIHRCTKCGAMRRNKSATEDNAETLRELLLLSQG